MKEEETISGIKNEIKQLRSKENKTLGPGKRNLASIKITVS